MTIKIDIAITTDIDLSDLGRRLTDEERDVMVVWEDRILSEYQNRWIGWQYTGRPPGAPRLVSHDAWSSTVDSTIRGISLTIINDARDWRTGRRPYSSYVRRSKNAVPEWEIIAADVERELLPGMERALTDVIVAELEVPQRRRKIVDTRTSTEVLELEI